MEFRRLTINDLNSYYDFRMRMLKHAPSKFLATLEEEQARGKGHFEEVLSHQGDDKVIFGAVSDGRVVGSMGVFREERLKFVHKALFWELSVDPEFQGKGIAPNIFKLAVDHSKNKMDVQLVRLQVESENHTAKKLFESYGFRTWGAEPKAMKSGNDFFSVDHMILDFQ